MESDYLEDGEREEAEAPKVPDSTAALFDAIELIERACRELRGRIAAQYAIGGALADGDWVSTNVVVSVADAEVFSGSVAAAMLFDGDSAALHRALGVANYRMAQEVGDGLVAQAVAIQHIFNAGMAKAVNNSLAATIATEVGS